MDNLYRLHCKLLHGVGDINAAVVDHKHGVLGLLNFDFFCQGQFCCCISMLIWIQPHRKFPPLKWEVNKSFPWHIKASEKLCTLNRILQWPLVFLSKARCTEWSSCMSCGVLWKALDILVWCELFLEHKVAWPIIGIIIVFKQNFWPSKSKGNWNASVICSSPLFLFFFFFSF